VGPFDVVTIDVAFISLVHPPASPCSRRAQDVVALVKPQFEAGRREVGRGGIVSDPAVQQRVVDEVVAAASAVGLERLATTESPITGTSGNREFFVHLRRP
jgi:23S rRNA (cytidine1920-2'-O)/16S rRNA (cytidine1409-2'-O)-methyltransferase